MSAYKKVVIAKDVIKAANSTTPTPIGFGHGLLSYIQMAATRRLVQKNAFWTIALAKDPKKPWLKAAVTQRFKVDGEEIVHTYSNAHGFVSDHNGYYLTDGASPSPSWISPSTGNVVATKASAKVSNTVSEETEIWVEGRTLYLTEKARSWLLGSTSAHSFAYINPDQAVKVCAKQ